MGREIPARELAKSILQGVPPARPLFLPIVFSLAARIENLPFQAWLKNPTKITQALRQIRPHMRSDGITCYFDPYLEIEALGGALEWRDVGQPAVRFAGAAASGGLLHGFSTIDELPAKGRIPVAIEVVSRLKSLVREECLLTVGISGPFALAAQLIAAGPEAFGGMQLPGAALDLAAGACASVARALVEAGASVIFIREEAPHSLPGFPDLADLLATTINIVQFYDAIPVLILRCDSQAVAQAAQQSLNCIVCPVLAGSLSGVSELNPTMANLGLAIPVGLISGQAPGLDSIAKDLHRLGPDFHPALITTSGDIPETEGLKNLNKLREFLIP